MSVLLMQFPISFFPAKRRVRRKRKTSSPAGPSGVAVVAVTVWNSIQVDFEFSADVTASGAGTTAILVTGTGSGDISPVGSTSVSSRVVRFEFESGAGIAGGEGWVIDAQPDCLDFGDQTLAVPQSGVVG